MKLLLQNTHVDAKVCDRLRAFSLFFRYGYQTAVRIYPELAEYLLRNKDKSMEEVLRDCYEAERKEPSIKT